MRQAQRKRLLPWGLGALAALFLLAPAPASAAVEWRLESKWAPTPLVQGKGRIQTYIHNSGESAAPEGSFLVKFYFPEGVTWNNDSGLQSGAADGTGLDCPLAIEDGGEQFGLGKDKVLCEGVKGFNAFASGEIRLGIDIAPGTPRTEPYKVVIEGAGDAFEEAGEVAFGNQIFDYGLVEGTVRAGSFDAEENDYDTAGGHPFASIGEFDVAVERFGAPPGGVPRHILTDLPPGFVGNPLAVPSCPTHLFEANECPPESQIGWIFTWGIPPPITGVYSIDPPAHLPAQIGFRVSGYRIIGTPVVRPDNGDYAIQVQFVNQPAALPIPHYKLVIWGVPGDPAHDGERCSDLTLATLACEGSTPTSGPNPFPEHLPVIPFLSNPTNCADQPTARFHTSQWGAEGPLGDLTHPNWKHTEVFPPKVTGCDQLEFEPTIDFETTTKRADSATGLDVDLHIPQDGLLEPEGLATAHLKRVVTELPDGLAFNASAATGLKGCTPEQIGLISEPGEVPRRFNSSQPRCPKASKIANATIETPVLDNDLEGEVFLASQDENAFAATYSIYITVREPSILVKLPGKVDLDPATGAVTTTFDRNPQLPFTDLHLDFFDGPRAALATPPTCGRFTTRTEFAPWSAKDPSNPTSSEVVDDPDPFTIAEPAGGAGDCPGSLAEIPFAPGLAAGSAIPVAGAHTPFRIQITRPDGQQELAALDISPPPGFTASLRGMPYCPEAAIANAPTRKGKAEQASPSCPPGSQIGTTLAGAGAGSSPYYAPGKVYLAGPYKGAPLSAVAITPAVAGPFDLGNVLVRSALHLDPTTARITARTDPLPKTIDGVPLRIKDLRIDLNRPNWAINPTNCSELQVNVTAYGVGGAIAKPANRFQLGGCRALGFKPKLAIRLKGGTQRADHPAFKAVVVPRAGDANFARAAVKLPRSAFLDQSHIRTICTRVQFASDTCPPGAIYGYARAWTPLLDHPVQGPVYLRSSDNNLPDMVADLRAPAHQPIRVELVGRIDSVGGGIRNTFDLVPDAPVTRFVLTMQGGKKGLITNSRNLCAKPSRALANLRAQNGRRALLKPRVVATGCKKGKRRGGKRGRR